MSKEVYEPVHQSRLKCKDCGYSTDSAVEFTEHVHMCPIKPVPIPSGEVERKRLSKL